MSACTIGRMPATLSILCNITQNVEYLLKILRENGIEIKCLETRILWNIINRRAVLGLEIEIFMITSFLKLALCSLPIVSYVG